MKWYRQGARDVVEPTIPVAHTDARRSDGPTRRGDPDPERRRSERLRRRMRVLAFNVVFIGGILAALIGRGGYFDLVRHRGQRQEARLQAAEQEARNEALRRAIDALERDPAAKERIAREQLGMADPGEIQFLLPREDAKTPAPDAAPGRVGEPSEPQD